MSYGELIGGKSFAIKLDPKQPVKEKAPKDYKVVGKSLARVDIPGKVTGSFTYMQDFRVPGMLHGRVVRPPRSAPSSKAWTTARSRRARHRQGGARGQFPRHRGRERMGGDQGRKLLKATWSKSETLPDQTKLWDMCARPRSPRKMRPAISATPPRHGQGGCQNGQGIL